MQHDHILKKSNFGLGPHSLSPPKGSESGLQTEIPFDMFHIYCCSACMQNFSKKILIIALVIVKFKYLTFDPLGGVKKGGVKL